MGSLLIYFILLRLTRPLVKLSCHCSHRASRPRLLEFRVCMAVDRCKLTSSLSSGRPTALVLPMLTEPSAHLPRIYWKPSVGACPPARFCTFALTKFIALHTTPDQAPPWPPPPTLAAICVAEGGVPDCPRRVHLLCSLPLLGEGFASGGSHPMREGENLPSHLLLRRVLVASCVSPALEEIGERKLSLDARRVCRMPSRHADSSFAVGP